MPVNDTHPLYDANALIWQRIRNVCEGSDAVKKVRDEKKARRNNHLALVWGSEKQQRTVRISVAGFRIGFIRQKAGKRSHTIPATYAFRYSSVTPFGLCRYHLAT
jgi:hypothetical protein